MEARPEGEWSDIAFAERWAATADDLNPLRSAQIELIVELLSQRDVRSVLDLGVGPGLIADRILEELPDTTLTGLDSSTAMIELAGARLERHDGRVRLGVADLAADGWEHAVDGPFDAAISVQTLHNLEPTRNRAALAATATIVRPGGFLILSDRFSVAPDLFGEFSVIWRRLGVDEGSDPEAHTEKLKRHGDEPVALQTALQWLDEVGFEAACIENHGVRAVIVAQRR